MKQYPFVHIIHAPTLKSTYPSMLPLSIFINPNNTPYSVVIGDDGVPPSVLPVELSVLTEPCVLNNPLALPPFPLVFGKTGGVCVDGYPTDTGPSPLSVNLFLA